MSSVKRYEPRDPAPAQHPEGSYVRGEDYDSLLAVLRRCVEPMEVSLEWLDGKQGTGMICELLRQTLSAARAVLEESAEARKEGKR